jgi:ribosome-binding factor A
MPNVCDKPLATNHSPLTTSSMSRRLEKAAEAIREVVSMAILTELNDPRIRDVTVTFVEVSADLRHAKVHVSVMGDEARQKLTLRGLQSAAGFLQSKIAKGIEIRYTPKLSFLLDQGVKHSIEVARILQEVLPKEPAVFVDDEEASDDTPSASAAEESASGGQTNQEPTP